MEGHRNRQTDRQQEPRTQAETERAVTPAVSRRATGGQGWEDLVLGEGTASPGLSQAGETCGAAPLEGEGKCSYAALPYPWPCPQPDALPAFGIIPLTME